VIGLNVSRLFFMLGAGFAFLAVAGGAFGAHSLKAILTPDMLAVFETGVRYQMYHALALLVVGWAAHQYPPASFHIAGWLFVAGILLFSGSLYVLALSGVRWLGAITPLGGVLFLAGWAVFAWQVFKQR
jgi:uncharacterized membrane protein YgdD (TMEM256/DUF423 family)